MKFNYRKIASVLASVVMLGSTVGIAAAATNYPAPFVSGGAANVAVVYGSNAAFSDGLAAGEFQSNLQFELGKATATGGTTTAGTVSGEAAPLFTGATKIYLNDSVSQVKSAVTKTEMPVLLKDQSYSGNVDATVTQTITMGSLPKLIYSKQPTSSDDPQFGVAMSSSADKYLYNATATFNKAVDLTHTDSKNQEINLFGQKFMIGSATTSTDLVLLKSAEKLNFDSSGTTSQEVTIEGKKYTVEMVSASATAATVKVTNEAGASEQKEVTEGYSKKINGLTIAVNTADSNNLKYTASLVAGAEKITLTSGSAVTYGDAATIIDGTKVLIVGGIGNITKLMVSAYAPSSDKDAILPGKSFVDPVFGTFKVDFSGLNIDVNSSAREDILVKSSGDDKITLTMTDINANTKTVQWAYNGTTIGLWADADGHKIRVAERETANRSDYIMVGNEAEGHLIKVATITNTSTSGYTGDAVTFTDAFSGETYTTTITVDGAGTATIGGKVYDVVYNGKSDLADEAKTVRLNYPDSSAAGSMVLYPTIKTSKGAKVAFYAPVAINAGNWDGTTNLTQLKFPDGDGYTDIVVRANETSTGNLTVNGVTLQAVGTTSTSFMIGKLNYTATFGGDNNFTINLVTPGTSTLLTDPALVVFEEKDDNTNYEALVVTLEQGNAADDGIGVTNVIRTWQTTTSTGGVDIASGVTGFFRDTVYSNNKLTREADLYGTIATEDSTDSDQKQATISYPDEQVYGQIYVSAIGATVTAGVSSGGSVTDLGSVAVKDTEITSVSTKNLVVVGGSCINTVAAKILGSDTPICGADFTTKAGVGANQALIKVVTSPYAADKVAMLVAGYEAADTTKAVKYVTTEKPATDTNTTKKLSTSATVATVVV